MIYVVEMNEWGCRLYSDVGNVLTFVSLCDKNAGVSAICGVGYSLENTLTSFLAKQFVFRYSNLCYIFLCLIISYVQ